MSTNKKVKVMVVDDSAVVRNCLEEILSSDPEIEVIATAADPFLAAHKLKKDVPDVITLDIAMPRMDGIAFLQKIMSQHPIPVVMCSYLAEKGSEIAMKAMEFGAVDIITKPKVGVREFFHDQKIMICDIIKAAAQVKVKLISLNRNKIEKKLTADVILPPPRKLITKETEKIIVIGASTGGTEALKEVLEVIPKDSPGIVIVQHMPENFTTAFAKRLNEICQIEVKEGEQGDKVERGRAIIAPGNKHMILKSKGKYYVVEIKDGPLVCRHRPSVDVLFRSAARYAGPNAVGVIMTGMGDDGARGMLEMKEAGAFTIAQDEATCTVFGMPGEAIKRNAVDKIVPLDKIAKTALEMAEK